MYSSYSRWSGVLKSSSAMTKMTVEPIHRRSCANSSALPIQLVWKWPDVPCSGLRKPGVGSAAAENRPKTARRATQDRPPRRRWRRRSLCAHPAKAPFNPTPTAQRRSRGRAALSEGLIATSHTFSAPLQGQHGQRCGGAPSSGTARRLTGRRPLSSYFDYCQEHATHHRWN